MSLHAELIRVVHGRISALNSAGAPSPPIFDTRRFLQYWDRETVVDARERNFVYQELRKRVVGARRSRAKAAHLKAETPYESFKRIMGEAPLVECKHA